MVLNLANSDNPVKPRKVLSIIAVAVLHIFAGGIDQFISNVLRGEGYAHQVNIFTNLLNCKSVILKLILSRWSVI